MEVQKEPQLKLFEHYFKYLSMAMVINMMYPTVPKTRIKIAGVLFTVLYIGSGTVFCLYSMVHSVLQMDMTNATRQLSLVNPTFLMTMKVILTYFQTNELRSFIDQLNEKYSKLDEMKKYERDALLRSINEGQTGEKIWILMSIIVSVAFPLVAFSEMTYLNLRHNSTKRVMVFEFFVPFFDEHKYEFPVFHIVFTYSMIMVVFCITNFLAFDGSFLVFISYSRCQIDLVGMQLRDTIKNIEYATEFKREIVKVIKLHQNTLRFVDRLNKVYSPYMFVIFCLSSVQLCVTVYQITEAFRDKDLKVEYLTFTLGTITQIFLPCFYGSRLTASSEELGTYIFCSGWEKIQDSDLRRIIGMIIMRTQKTIKASALGIVTLDMVTFISIINTSYSYFTLLQSSK